MMLVMAGSLFDWKGRMIRGRRKVVRQKVGVHMNVIFRYILMNVKERNVDTVALPDVGQRSPVETMNRKQKNADNKKQKVS